MDLIFNRPQFHGFEVYLMILLFVTMFIKLLDLTPLDFKKYRGHGTDSVFIWFIRIFLS